MLSVANEPLMLCVIIPNVVVLSVVAPKEPSKYSLVVGFGTIFFLFLSF
jgi:hypothetical protein